MFLQLAQLYLKRFSLSHKSLYNKVYTVLPIITNERISIMNNHVFALDIGTQSVTGILLQKVNDKYKVIDFCTRQHKERSMLDGQIHDVVQVAEVIKEVKYELEQKNGPLQKVCVAAAGRALKTVYAEKTIDITDRPIATEEEVKHLELSAVQQAQLKLTDENKQQFQNYHCVGYSVLHYKLDGEKIGSFIDQVGEKATVEIIATFLPKIVVESLLAALERAELTMEALTLEPIAAIDVLVPDSMRRLNVTLIDIGAGTSDIAIANDGTVVAYGMVPVAGDEITEAISDKYILDFKVAEETKREIIHNKYAKVQDILGFETEITYDELLPEIIDRIDYLAKLLADEIRKLNSKSPQAVMLIGGGSLTPKINEKLAEYLQLPINRVAVRGVEAIQLLQPNEKLPKGPDFVTPIGIAISATQKPLHYSSVTVNGKTTLMFETKQLTVGDALVQAGININQYYGKIGLALIVTINGKETTLPGEYGQPPNIYVNGKEASVQTPISSGDDIVIEKGEDGKEPSVTIEDVVGKLPTIPFYFHDKLVALKPIYKVNGEEKDLHYILKDKDNIFIEMPKTVEEFLKSFNDDNLLEHHHFHVFVNESKVEVYQGNIQVLLNGKVVNPKTFIYENDRLTIRYPEKITVKKLLQQLEKEYWLKIDVTFNGKPITLKQQRLVIKRNEETLDEETILHHGDELTIVTNKVRPFIFQDVFRFTDIELNNVKGYEVLRNGQPANFHEQITDGDKLEIVLQ